jgi:rubrerythrin
MSENKTLANLMEAFAGEAQANRKYLAYAKKAEKEGKMNAAKLFRAASDAETLHALKHFEVAGKIGSTADNLKDAVAGETYEYKEMYPDFVKEAEVEKNKAALMSFTFAMMTSGGTETGLSSPTGFMTPAALYMKGWRTTAFRE